MQLLRHNWISTFNLRLGYETMIFTSHLQLEQRRALRTVPTIEITIDSFEAGENARKLLSQTIQYVYAPFSPEKFTGVRGLVGSKSVTISTDISYFFVLKTLPNLYVCDSDGNYAKIVSLVGNVLTLDGDLAGTSVEMFPCLKCITKNVEETYTTNGMVNTSFVLEHIKG